MELMTIIVVVAGALLALFLVALVVYVVRLFREAKPHRSGGSGKPLDDRAAP